MSEWIDVKERLPEDDCLVLGTTDKWGSDIIVCFYYHTYNVFKPQYGYKLGLDFPLDVTHWMLIPEKPRMK
jgi:hypothetical protein